MRWRFIYGIEMAEDSFPQNPIRLFYFNPTPSYPRIGVVWLRV